MALVMSPPEEQISIKVCRDLLQIQTKDTIREYLKVLGWSDRTSLAWDEIKQIVQLQSFLGLKPGLNSKQEYSDRTPEQLEREFADYGINIDERLNCLKEKYANRTDTRCSNMGDCSSTAT